ncbi:B12-binding domain-containing radical SAM protein [Acidobacteriota bacterium]
MKISLVKPCWKYPVNREDATYNRIWMPLSLAYCATLLEADGHEVTILDAHAERLKPKTLAERCAQNDMIFLTTSSYDRWQCPNVQIDPVLAACKSIREKNPNLFVMGYHGTVKPVEMLKNTGAMAIIRGEPELIVREVAGGKGLKKIEGLTFESNGDTISTPDRPLTGMEMLPVPSFRHLDMDKYTYEILGDRCAVFEASRGCPYTCSFCVKVMFGNRFRKKPVENLIEEVRIAVEDFGVKTGYFLDLEFTLNRKIVFGLCEFLKEKRYNFKWCCQTRADKVDKEILTVMRESGCKIIHFGIESGSDALLGQHGKRTDVASLEHGVKLARKLGFKIVCFFLFGLPGETQEDRIRTIKLAKTLNPTYASFHIVHPYPGTELYDMVKTSNGKLFPVTANGPVLNSKLEKSLRRALLSFYLRPSYIFNLLKSGAIQSPRQMMKIFLSRIKG